MKRVFHASRKPVKRYTGISILNTEELLYFFVIKAGSYNAKTTNNTRSTSTNVGLTGNVIKVNPITALALYYALRAKDHTV